MSESPEPQSPGGLGLSPTTNAYPALDSSTPLDSDPVTPISEKEPADEQIQDSAPQYTQYTKDFGLIPMPQRLRYDPEHPFHFGLPLNIAFAFACCFVAANLYYCQPLLIQLASSFQVSESIISRVPTLVQSGYATGLLLISPLGDLVRRRQLILALVILSTTLTIGLAVTTNATAFQALSFIVGVVSVTPQILIPLAADLAPAHRRASAISIVFTGLILGVLISRVLAGIIANFTSWRIVYYVSIGVQSTVLLGGYLVIPDYPRKNQNSGLTYFDILKSMAKLAVTEPLLIQSCLIMMASSATFTNFWVTLTFLLGGPIYHFSTLVIGLFGLVGLFGVCMGPLIGRIVDSLILWYAVLIATLGVMVFQSIYIGAGGVSVAAVVIVCFGLDMFIDMQQISLSTTIFGLSSESRSRINAVFVLSLFIGQVIGTSVGTKVFLQHGYRASGALSLGLIGFQLFILFLRGPHVGYKTWFGYKGGFGYSKKRVQVKSEGYVEETKGTQQV